MPESEAGAGGGESPAKAENADAGADSKPADTTTGNEAAGGGEDGGGKEPAKPGTDNAKAPKKEPASEDADDGAEPAVRSRKSPKDFIIQRQQRKIAKANKAGSETGEDGGEADDDEINPKDAELINKVVSPLLEPILAGQIKAENEQEVAAFLKENPEFAPFEAKAKRYMAHPSRAQLPVEAVFFEVAGKALIKIGADRQKKADEDARNSQTGGGSNRAGEGSGKNVWDMTPEEFEAEQQRVQSGKAA